MLIGELTLLVAIGGAVVAAAGFLYTCFPSEFISFLNAFIGSIMKYSAVAGCIIQADIWRQISIR
jgi:hypothetical protein